MYKLILNLLLLNVTFINYSFSQNVKLINAFPGITFNKPIEFITTNDGTNRIFIVEQGEWFILLIEIIVNTIKSNF